MANVNSDRARARALRNAAATRVVLVPALVPRRARARARASPAPALVRARAQARATASLTRASLTRVVRVARASMVPATASPTHVSLTRAVRVALVPALVPVVPWVRRSTVVVAAIPAAAIPALDLAVAAV